MTCLRDYFLESNNFSVNPPSVHVRAEETVNFQMIFKPNKENKLYSSRIVGQIHWKRDSCEENRKQSINIPINCSLYCIGSTNAIIM